MEQSPLGELRLETLRHDLASSWFATGYDRFTPDDDEGFRRVLSASSASMDFLEMEIFGFIGTWCPDCQEHLPVFARILAAVGFPSARVHFYGLDRAKTFPEGKELVARHAIVRLPTFVFLRGGVELGRITETPEYSLIEDWAKILARR